MFEPLHLWITGSFIALFCIVFLAIFLVPGLRCRGTLKTISSCISDLESTKSRTPSIELLYQFKKIFDIDKRLQHLWNEFEETLHQQQEERDGQMHVFSVRSTIPADSYFNEQFIVDSRLYTEFFKHLPGIFTGIGIIGTFIGLIEGLKHFQVSENAAIVRSGLEALMHAVGDAFLVSASAITAAIIVTFLEKWLLAALYKQTEEIAHSIDKCFEAGVGEEYLSRLVNSSEDAASQTKILKDALVQELGDILRELTAQQLEAAQHNHQNLGNTIADAIKDSLEQPLRDIGNSVKKASGEQSSAAIDMLQDIMVSFSQKLSDLFGDQISGINDLNQQTAKIMQDAVAALNTLVAKLEESGKKTTDDMGSTMEGLMKAMGDQQANIGNQTEQLIKLIQQMIESSQTETQQKLQTMLDSIEKQLTVALNKINDSQQSVTEQNHNTVRQITGSVEAAIDKISIASETMAQSVLTLTSATTSAVDKMAEGANRLDAAATNFSTAGDRVSNVLNQTATIGNKLTELSGALTTSSGALQEALRDYKTQREAVGSLLIDIRTTVEQARKEASFTGDVLKHIEASAAKLNQAQLDAQEYLDGISTVLAESSEKFQDSVTSTLSRVNSDFHTKLSNAVGLLSGAVQELEATFGSITPTGR